MSNPDRTVHAVRAGGCEIVRYCRAGKWALEWPVGRSVGMQRISLTRAVDEALMAEHEDRGRVFLGLPGGRAFDAAFRRRSVNV